MEAEIKAMYEQYFTLNRIDYAVWFLDWAIMGSVLDGKGFMFLR